MMRESLQNSTDTAFTVLVSGPNSLVTIGLRARTAATKVAL